MVPKDVVGESYMKYNVPAQPRFALVSGSYFGAREILTVMQEYSSERRTTTAHDGAVTDASRSMELSPRDADKQNIC